MITITETFQLDKEAKNPINVKVTIEADYDYPHGWEWEVKDIIWAELMVADKQGIDITESLLANKRATELLTSQISDDDVYEALGEKETAA